MWWYPIDAPLILASRSPRRMEILRMTGIPFITAPGNIPEDGFNGPPGETVKHWARMKAMNALDAWKDHPVLGADTLVSLEGELLGKPEDHLQAKQMLGHLSGRWHTVFGGVCVLWPERDLDLDFVETTRVRFRELSDEEINAYIETGEPMDKAGAYGIQGLGSLLVERVEGCFFNVMGLPVARLMQLMRRRLTDGS